MSPTDLVWDALGLVVATAIVIGLPVCVVAIVLVRLRRRRVAVPVGAAAVLVSLILGYALLASERAPAIRVAAILLVAGLVAATALPGRLTVAGLVLIVTALPWTAYAGAYLFDGATSARRIDAAIVLPPFMTGIAAILVGLALIRFHRGYLARRPGARGAAAATTEAPARSWDAASRAGLGPSVLGLNLAAVVSIVVLAGGTQATVLAGHGRPILEILAIVLAGSIATGIVASLVWTVAWLPRPRRSYEAFAWLGESELERFRNLAGGQVGPTIANMKRYVRNTAERPEDRWIRVDILAATGKLDEAREIAGRLPDDTPLERVERANYVGYIDWLSGGPGDTAELRTAVDAIVPTDGDDRLRAEVALALAEVRVRISAGQDVPAAPLRAVRDRIGRRADGIFLALARRLAPGYLKVSTAFIVVITIIDRTLSS